MLTTVKTLVRTLHEENMTLKEEIKFLKQKLGYSNTRINDLRYSKKQLLNALKKHEEKQENRA